jgi:riboflavin synthase alpha subunit
MPFLAPKGSVALDGVSLTVNSVEGCQCDVMLVPFTLEHTTLSRLAPGQELNIEADLLARYVARVLGAQGSTGKPLAPRAQDAERDRALMQALRRANMA